MNTSFNCCSEAGCACELDSEEESVENAEKLSLAK